MIKFADKLYVSESIKNVEKVKRRLGFGRGQLEIYLITISNSDDQLEYFHNALLKQKAIYKQGINVVGLAESSSECVELIERILQDTYNATGRYDMKTFLLGKNG